MTGRAFLLLGALLLGLLHGACGDDDTGGNNNNAVDPLCGDGNLDPGEACDDGPLNSDTTPDACRTNCRLQYCGDGVVDTGEVCDGAELEGEDCVSQGATKGTLRCGADCTGFDLSGCSTCGNAAAEGAVETDDHYESCDGTDLRGLDCTDIGYPQGVLDCAADCTWDTSLCLGGDLCGNGHLDAGEACDEGENNAQTPNAPCRIDCTLPRCGDGVTDDLSGEECDCGSDSGAQPAACDDPNGGLASSCSTGCLDAVAWARVYRGDNEDVGQVVAVDADGNIAVAGWFKENVRVENNTLLGDVFDNIFLAKYDAAGNRLWFKRLAGAGYDRPEGLAFDSQGNLLLTGTFSSSVNFGGGVVAPGGYFDTFLVKYDPGGNWVWDLHLTTTGLGAGTGNKMVKDLVVDSSDNVIIVGEYTGYFRCVFNPPCTEVDGDAAFIRKYSSSGGLLWSRGLDSPFDQAALSVAVGQGDDVIVSGKYAGSIDLLNGFTFTSPGEYTDYAFLARFDASDGHTVWARSFGDGVSTLDQYGMGVATGPAGEMTVTGYYSGDIVFGSGISETSAGGEDLFVASYDAGGAYQWHLTAGNTVNQRGLGVARDVAGNVILTGYFAGQVDFGGGILSAPGNSNIFVTKLDPSGGYLWSKGYGTGIANQGMDVTTDATGRIVLTGFLMSDIDFSGVLLSHQDSSDGILVVFNP